MTTISFDKLLEAFEYASFSGDFDSRAYLDLETGHIYSVTDGMEEFEELPADIETSDCYVMLPDKRDLALGRNLAFSFAEQFLPDEYKNVVDCFRKKGDSARFKDLLDRHDALTQWHEFGAKQTEIALRGWCRQNDIQFVGGGQSRAPRSNSQLCSKQPSMMRKEGRLLRTKTLNALVWINRPAIEHIHWQ